MVISVSDCCNGYPSRTTLHGSVVPRVIHLPGPPPPRLSIAQGIHLLRQYVGGSSTALQICNIPMLCHTSTLRSGFTSQDHHSSNIQVIYLIYILCGFSVCPELCFPVPQDHYPPIYLPACLFSSQYAIQQSSNTCLFKRQSNKPAHHQAPHWLTPPKGYLTHLHTLSPNFHTSIVAP